MGLKDLISRGIADMIPNNPRSDEKVKKISNNEWLVRENIERVKEKAVLYFHELNFLPQSTMGNVLVFKENRSISSKVYFAPYRADKTISISIKPHPDGCVVNTTLKSFVGYLQKK